MAIGDLVNLGNQSYTIELLASATAPNGAPSGSSGIAESSVRALLGYIPNTIRVALRSTAGSDAMSVTATLWQRLGSTVGWVVAKRLNGGAAITEAGNDSIAYTEEVSTLSGADRYYLQVVAIDGTSTAVTGYFIVAPRVEA